MSWQNAWALTGLAALVAPVLIHLLSRTQARIQQFPTLRFLDVSRLLPTRSPRITDLPLLLVRLCILASAVVALAGPLFATGKQTRSASGSLARATVVDTSRSVAGRAPAETDSLLAKASRLTGNTIASTVIRTADVSSGVASAVAWLETQEGRGEVVVLSDFQTSTVDSATLATVPAQYGLKLIRANAAPSVAIRDAAPGNIMYSMTSAVDITSEPTRTVAEWSVPPSPNHESDAASNGVMFLTADQDSSLVEYATRAAVQIVAPPLRDTTMGIAIVFVGSPAFASLASKARALNKPWMGQILERLQASDLFRSALDNADVANDTILSAPFFVLGRNRAGLAVVYAAQANVGGRERVLLYARTGAASIAAVQLAGAAASSIGVHWNASELETHTISDATLASLQRDASPATERRLESQRKRTDGPSDARWFWALTLLLLSVESYVRRAKNHGQPAAPPVIA